MFTLSFFHNYENMKQSCQPSKWWLDSNFVGHSASMSLINFSFQQRIFLFISFASIWLNWNLFRPLTRQRKPFSENFKHVVLVLARVPWWSSAFYHKKYIHNCFFILKNLMHFELLVYCWNQTIKQSYLYHCTSKRMLTCFCIITIKFLSFQFIISFSENPEMQKEIIFAALFI